MRILVFGASITYGAWDTEGGWVDRLKRKLHLETVDSGGIKRIQLLNLGVGGDTATKILERLEREIEVRQSSSWPFAFVISLGTNDSRITEGKEEMTTGQFESEINRIITITKKFSDKILFLGPPPLGKSKVLFKNYEYSDERIKTYEARMKNVVDSSGFRFLSIRPMLEKSDISNLFVWDNLHLNDKGHKIVADMVYPEIKKLVDN